MDVWTKFEEGRSRHSRVIDRKRKGYRPYRLTGFFEGRYKKAESMIYVYPLY